MLNTPEGMSLSPLVKLPSINEMNLQAMSNESEVSRSYPKYGSGPSAQPYATFQANTYSPVQQPMCGNQNYGNSGHLHSPGSAQNSSQMYSGQVAVSTSRHLVTDAYGTLYLPQKGYEDNYHQSPRSAPGPYQDAYQQQYSPGRMNTGLLMQGNGATLKTLAESYSLPPINFVRPFQLNTLPVQSNDGLAAHEIYTLQNGYASNQTAQMQHPHELQYPAAEVVASPTNKCHRCGATKTPEWRRGPNGVRTLCNACGLYHAKLVKRKGAILAAEDVLSKKVCKDKNGRRRTPRNYTLSEDDARSRANINLTAPIKTGQPTRNRLIDPLQYQLYPSMPFTISQQAYLPQQLFKPNS